MSTAIDLLRRILDASSPGGTVTLTTAQASLLATLGEQELGELSGQIAAEGEVAALQKYGLKGRRVVVLPAPSKS